ncbi:MAG: beta strand repeat-containing protein [Arachnia sp.]
MIEALSGVVSRRIWVGATSLLLIALMAVVPLPRAAADTGDVNDAGLAAACYNTSFGTDQGPTANGVGSNSAAGNLTQIMYSGRTAFDDDNNVNIIRMVGNPVTAISTIQSHGGISFTHDPGPQSHQVSNVTATTLQQAESAGAYLEFSFTTDGDFASAALDWAGFLNRPATNPAYSLAYSISAGGGPFTTLAQWSVPTNYTGSNAYPYGRFNTKVDYTISANTQYTVRIYPYAAAGSFEIDDMFVAFDVCTYTISGTVMNDITDDGNVNGTGIATLDGTQLYAALTSPTGTVLNTAAIASDGTYAFIGVNHATNYRVVLTDSPPTIGGSVSAHLPAGWIHTGEDFSDQSGNDGTADGAVSAFTTNGSVPHVDFGVARAPILLEVSKQVTSLTPVDVNGNAQVDDEVFDVVYRVAVTNNSVIGTDYTLTDTPGFSTGVAIQAPLPTVIAVGSAPTPTNSWNGSVLTIQGAATPIAAGATHSYDVTIRTSIAGLNADPGVYTACSSGDPSPGEGFYNQASISHGGLISDTAEACTDLPSPRTEVTKSATASEPVFLGNGRYQVVWDVTVTNPGSVPASYDLADVFTPGTGITVESAAVATSPSGIGDGGFDGATDTVLASDQIIGPATTHTYTVTSVLAVPAGAAPADLTCNGSTPGSGLFNTATLDGSTAATACVSVPQGELSLSKTVSLGPSLLDPATGRYSIEYTITARNTGNGPLTYDLSDALELGDGISVAAVDADPDPNPGITQVTTTSAGGLPKGTAVASWSGSGATTTAFTGVPLGAGEVDTYRVVVEVLADAGLSPTAADCELSGGETGTGLRNSASASYGATSVNATACGQIPPGQLNITKSIASAPVYDSGSGLWSAAYWITVYNAADGPGTYTLTDDFGFAPGTTVEAVSVTGPSGIAVNPGFDGDGDQRISGPVGLLGRQYHTYRVTVSLSVDASFNPADAGCATPQPGAGMFNTASLDNGATDSVCAALGTPEMSIAKVFQDTDGDPANGDPTGYSVDGAGNFTMVYDVIVTNSGSAPGFYLLTDQVSYGGHISATNVSVVTDSGSPLNPNFDGGVLTAADTAVISSPTRIEPGGTHTFTITVSGTAVDVGPADPAADCTLDGGETGTGYLNTATLTSQGLSLSDDACHPAEPPVITMTKSATTAHPVINPDQSLSASYVITVSNSGGGAGTYDLRDTLQLGDQITVGSAAITNTSPGGITVNPAWDGATATTVVTDQLIAAGQTHTYLVTLTASVAGAATASARDCTLDSGEAGTGLLNGASLDHGGDVVTSSACLAAPMPTYLTSKRVVAGPQQTADGNWQLSYLINVGNSGGGPGSYQLSDALAFGEGAEVISATATNLTPGTVSTNAAWNGADTTAITTGQVPLPAGAVHTYQVDVEVDTSRVTSATAADCTLDSGETGTGLRNAATLTPANADAVSAEACAQAPLSHITHTKTVLSGPELVSGDTYEVNYQIVVANSGGGAGHYDLDDALDLGTGLSDVTATVSVDQPSITPDAGWDGIGATTLATDQQIMPAVGGVATTHVWRVRVRFNVDATMTIAERRCATDGTGGSGAFNTATVSVGGAVTNESACVSIPEPNLAISKRVVSGPTLTADGTWRLAYRITVANTGTGPGSYELSDQLRPADGAVIQSATLSATDPLGLPINPGWDSVTDQAITASAVAIPAAQTHSYELSFEIDAAAVTDAGAADCVLGEAETGTGLRNDATLSTSESGALTASACAPVPMERITHSKRITLGPSLVSGTTYRVIYAINVANGGDGPGRYNLADSLDLASGLRLVSAELTAADSELTPDPAWDGRGSDVVTSGQLIMPAAGDVPRVQTWLVAVEFEVDPAMPAAERGCSVPASPGGGAFNSATLTVGGLSSDSAACASIPQASISVTKQVVGRPSPAGEGQWSISYDVTVANTGGGPGIYRLTDGLQFGHGITVESASVTNTAPGGIATNPGWDGLNDVDITTADEPLLGMTSHRYRVVAVAGAAGTLSDASADCALGAGEDGTGLRNRAGILTPDAGQQAQVCAAFPTEASMSLVKSIERVADSNRNDRVDAGDIIHYGFTIANTGASRLSDVAVTDDNAEVAGGPIDLAVGEVDASTFTASHVITVADVVSGGVENTAQGTATWGDGQRILALSDAGTAADGSDVDDPGAAETDNPLGENSNDSTNPADDPTTLLIEAVPSLRLTKRAVDDSFDAAGDLVRFEITVTNDGSVPLRDVMVADPRAETLGCQPGTSLDPGESLTCRATMRATADDVAASGATNRAWSTARWADQLWFSSDTASVAYDDGLPGMGGPGLAWLVGGAALAVAGLAVLWWRHRRLRG